jgi:Tn3 transposase DDE domain
LLKTKAPIYPYKFDSKYYHSFHLKNAVCARRRCRDASADVAQQLAPAAALRELLRTCDVAQSRAIVDDQRFKGVELRVQWMSKKLKELQAKRHPVDAEVLQTLSPYRRDHINRLGSYLLDLQRNVPPLDPSINFAFEPEA